MFSKTHDYAMRAVVALAEKPQEPLTTRQISALTGVPCTYLAKVLQLLARAQVIRGARGLGGGYVLRVPASELTLLDVANAVEPVLRITRCPRSITGHGADLCPLHRYLDVLIAAAETALRSMTVADLLTGHPEAPCPSLEGDGETHIHIEGDGDTAAGDSAAAV